MKRTYETPMACSEEFMPNEYVSACIVGSIQCVYPGNGRTNGDTGRYDDYNGRESGWFIPSDGLQHGICGNEADVSFNGNTASGYEVIGGRTQRNRRIFNVSGFNPEPGVYYDVTWNSQITGDRSVYYHKGRLTIDYIDNDHPNRS